MLSLVLLLTACTETRASSSSGAASATLADRVASQASADTERCPLRAADLDKLTTYRWRVAQYRADRGFFADPSIRLDMCELIGRDEKGEMRAGVTVNIAAGAHAGAFAKHLRAVCADSIQPDVRGTVRSVRDVSGGQQCVTATGSSLHWIESPGRTVEIELDGEDAAMATVVPQLLAAVVK
jgi:hypothetical protein